MSTDSSLLDEMAASLASTRQVIASMNAKFGDSDDMVTKDGISLLSLKHHVMISYLRSLALLSSMSVLGCSLSERTELSSAFSDHSRGSRGGGAGDLVDSMIEGRVVLEKTKVLEGRMRYQIDKLVRVAKEEQDGQVKDATQDPLAFRPNPQNLLGNDADADDDEEPTERAVADDGDGIYRPPRVAPVPYIPSTKSNSKEKRRPPPPSSLATLLHTDPSQPHAESTSGLGGHFAGQATSSRARYLHRLKEFEEEQFGRVMMGKKQEKRRQRDEAVLAIGGGLGGVGEDGSHGGKGRTAGGLADEFMDVLRDSGRNSRLGDGYDELRSKGKRGNMLERSRKRPVQSSHDESHSRGDQKRKRSRFELERKSVKKRKA